MIRDRKHPHFTIIAVMILLPLGPGSGKDYKGGELRTIEQAYLYGRFEVCYKPGRGSGQLASFFTYHEVENYPLDWNEIDIEILGRYSHDVQFNTITPGQVNHVRHQYVPFNAWEDFHVYAVEWTPTYVAWFIDGEEMHRQTGDHIEALNLPQKIMMNTWPPAHSNWAGEWDERILPVFHYYDWISYAAYDSGNGDTGTNNNFLFQWRDDFDSLNTNLWTKASHTFGGNNCDFVPENIAFSDGYMILCLTDAQNTGYVDRNPPSVLSVRATGDDITVSFSEDIDTVSALNPANYSIVQGNTLTGIDRIDSRTVKLTAEDLSPETTYSLVAAGIKDLAQPVPNTQLGQVVNFKPVSPLSLPIRINVGGPGYEDFLADTLWSDYTEYGYADGWTSEWPSAPVSGFPNGDIYRSARVDLVKYSVRVPAGTYKIALMMIENDHTTPAGRMFDIHIEDHMAADNLDLFALIGRYVPYIMVSDSLTVLDGAIDIHFSAELGQPLLSGIVIEPLEINGLGGIQLVPENIRLCQNYPNPFNASTIISFDMPSDALASLTIFNLKGQQVACLTDGKVSAGRHAFTWDPTASSGVYLYRLDAKSGSQFFSQTRRMLLLK